jgi:hypothetical protein
LRRWLCSSPAWLIEHHYASLSTVIAFVVVLALRFGTSLAAAGSGTITVIGARRSMR